MADEGYVKSVCLFRIACGYVKSIIYQDTLWIFAVSAIYVLWKIDGYVKPLLSTEDIHPSEYYVTKNNTGRRRLSQCCLLRKVDGYVSAIGATEDSW